MGGYIIADVNVSNPEQYEEYKKFSSHAMQVYGAQVCIRGGAVQVLEGDWAPERIVLLKFKSVEAAKEFYNSSQYAQARQARDGASITRMIVVEGV